MLRLEGPIVAQLQAVFLLSWHFQGGPMPAPPEGLDRFFPAIPDGEGVPMEILHNNPGEGHLPDPGRPSATRSRARTAGCT